MTSTVKVKAGSSTITRLFEIDSECSWDELKSQIRRLFDLQEEITLKYIDDEEEWVTLGTNVEFEEALKVTQKTGLLRLFVASSSDQRPPAGIESFSDLLGEAPSEIPVASKRKFVVNSAALSEPNSAFKTAKMDESAISEAVALPQDSSAPTNASRSCDFGLPSKEGNEDNERNDEADVKLRQFPSSVIGNQGDVPSSGEQYTPLVQLMVPPSSGRPPRPPPPTAKPRKGPSAGKGKGCYTQLAENVAEELAAVNEKLHQKLRSSFEKLQANNTYVQGLDEMEEDSYVFVNQQDNLVATNEDTTLPSGEVLSSPNQPCETEEEILDDESPCSPQNSLASDTNVEPHGVDQASIEQAVHRVVQKSLPNIVEQTLKNLKGLHLGDVNKNRSSAVAKVLHRGIFCAVCDQPVIGVRFKCCFCTDYDLCEDCEATPGIHDPNHFFVKLYNHVPGIGRKHGEMVPILKKCVYQTVLKEEMKNEWKERRKREKGERKEGKRKHKEERKLEKRKDKEERKEEKKRDKDEKKEWKKEKEHYKTAGLEEKNKREIRRKLREIRLERESATSMERLQNCLNAEFIADASIPDETVLKGGQKFLKRWTVKNKGRRWNAKTVLQCMEGNITVASGKNTVEVPMLKLDEQGELVVPFIAPTAPGRYESKWQLCHQRLPYKIPFGPLFWCQIVVEEEKLECEEAQKEKAAETAQVPNHDNTTLINSAFHEDTDHPVRELVKHIVTQGVVTEEADDGSGSEAYLSSEDTVESKKIAVPLESVLIATQAAQAAELEWDAAGCTLDTVSCEKVQIEELVVCTTAKDIGSDVESIFSDISDDFMVVPIPPCFIPEAPLTSDPAHVTVSVTEYKQMSESHEGRLSFDLAHASLEGDFNSGPVSASYTGQMVLTNVETTLEGDSNLAERGLFSSESPLEMTLTTTMEGDQNVFDLASETMPLLPEPLIPEPGLQAIGPAEKVSSALDSIESTLPITNEPLPAAELAEDDKEVVAEDDDDDDENDEVNADGPAQQQPETSPQPIAAQPVCGIDDPPPVALQPEPSSPVNVAPTTVRRSGVVQHIPNTSNDFPTDVVKDVLSTAFDAVASAGRAIVDTVDNLFTGNPKQEPTATYNPEQGCEISGNPTSDDDIRDAPEVVPVTWPPGRSPATCHECLMEMGFCDRKLNEQLLKKHNNNVALVVNELLSFHDNEWSTRRH